MKLKENFKIAPSISSHFKIESSWTLHFNAEDIGSFFWKKNKGSFFKGENEIDQIRIPSAGNTSRISYSFPVFHPLFVSHCIKSSHPFTFNFSWFSELAHFQKLEKHGLISKWLRCVVSKLIEGLLLILHVFLFLNFFTSASFDRSPTAEK